MQKASCDRCSCDSNLLRLPEGSEQLLSCNVGKQKAKGSRGGRESPWRDVGCKSSDCSPAQRGRGTAECVASWEEASGYKNDGMWHSASAFWAVGLRSGAIRTALPECENLFYLIMNWPFVLCSAKFLLTLLNKLHVSVKHFSFQYVTAMYVGCQEKKAAENALYRAMANEIYDGLKAERYVWVSVLFPFQLLKVGWYYYRCCSLGVPGGDHYL